MVARKILSEKVAFGQRKPGEGGGHVKVQGKTMSGRGKSECKGLMLVCPVCWRKVKKWGN